MSWKRKKWWEWDQRWIRRRIKTLNRQIGDKRRPEKPGTVTDPIELKRLKKLRSRYRKRRNKFRRETDWPWPKPVKIEIIEDQENDSFLD